KNLSIPPDAIVIKGDSLFVYAGFIDGLSRTGVIKPKEESKERPKDPANPTPERAGITPQSDVRDLINPTDKGIEELRAVGFTTAQVVPFGGMLPGKSAVISLNGKRSDDMVLVPLHSLYSELTAADRVYPSTIIGVLAKWKELYKQALLAKNYETLYASNRTGLTPPESNRVMESFYPVIEKRMPVLFKAERNLDLHRIVSLQKDLGFALTLADVKEGTEVVQKIKSSSAKVFLSLDLPEEKKKDDKKTESVLTTLSAAEKEALEKRKEETINKLVAQPVVFQQAAVPFGFSAMSVKTKDIQPNLRRMIKAGLTEDQALAALTINAAQLLGLSDRLGTLEAGKIANVMIAHRPYFHDKSEVKYVFVEGVQYKIDTPVKKDGAAGVVLEGEWSLSANTPQGKSESILVIKKSGDKYSGNLSGGQVTGDVTIETISFDGKTMKFSCTVNAGGQPVGITVEVTVDGNTFKGTTFIDGGESFPVEGKKTPKK
ncbi:MAG TPA: amidohydrolase family protein, partial [Chitinophagaceae bacterium]|nr:amidohydrolase family protein [Chitinophagaceae bacterium]